MELLDRSNDDNEFGSKGRVAYTVPGYQIILLLSLRRNLVSRDDNGMSLDMCIHRQL